MDTIAIIAAAVLGLIIGPFLRRAIDQVPGRRSLFADPDSPVRPIDLLPVASWFEAEPYGTTSYLVGPDDRQAAEGNDTDHGDATRTVKGRAIMIDVAAAALMALMAVRFGWNADLPAFLVLAAAVVLVSVIDIDHFRIPNLVVYPTLLVSSVLLAAAALFTGETGGLIGAAAGAAAYYGFLFIFFFVYPQGMGFGDVKLALVLGLHAGWAGSMAVVGGELFYAGWVHGMRLVLMAALVGSLLGAIIGVGSLVVRKQRGAFPFGPALCLGAVIAILLSEQILA